ncbi:hypothetical protein K402DRAFT_390348 [Aulographum hederae CBS 113979]|uniref:F-box domain-containing protein n=1 Tax=Aulographum hederae CBS 113979 TaxID=1176131 RepID=A0A6G1HA36_9PEZI|nr:hypothetical protein K402DRAFT_390348 [Aulographum hederae CBS 113979]
MAFSMNDLSDETVFRRLACRPDFIDDAVISSAKLPARVTFKKLQSRIRRPLGQLHSLPLELLHEALPYLDIRSLWSLARTCRRGKIVVEALPMFRDLVKSVGYTFAILRDAKILGMHSLMKLHAVLHSDRCVSCGAYGCFIFLLSAERCCFECQVVNPSLCVISVPVAGDCFGLKKSQLKSLPIMWSIPGAYDLFKSKSRQLSMRLVSLKAAKDLAVKVHGSLDALESKFPLDPETRNVKIAMFETYRKAYSPPIASDPLTCPYWTASGLRNLAPPSAIFGGMGVMPFPCLYKGRIEHGQCCSGCWYLSRTTIQQNNHLWDLLIPAGCLNSAPGYCTAEEYLIKLSCRAWSHVGLVEHGRECPFAATFMSQPGHWDPI